MPKLSGRAGLVALTAFLVVDVVLVGLAVSSTRQPVAGGGQQLPSSGAGASSTSGASGSSSSSPSSSSTSKPAAVTVVPATVGLVAVTGSTALRFTTGTCADGGSGLTLTRDGGRTWVQRPAPFDTTVRIRVRADGSAFAIGADSGGDCATKIRQADAFDGSFGDAQSVVDAWFRDPRRATTVGLPSGGTARPCGTGAGAVVDLAVADKGAAVVCSDGRVLESATGTGWDRAATVPGALAVARAASGRVLVAAMAVGDCDGIAVVDAARPATPLGCAAAKVAAVPPGSTALSVTSDSGWLVAGDATYRSDRSLSTWKKQ